MYNKRESQTHLVRSCDAPPRAHCAYVVPRALQRCFPCSLTVLKSITAPWPRPAFHTLALYALVPCAVRMPVCTCRVCPCRPWGRTEPWYRLGGIFRTRWPARAVVPARWYKSYTIPPRWYNCFFPLSPPPSCVLALYHCACQTRQYVCSYVRMPFLQRVRASICPLIILCTLWCCTHPLYSHLFFLRSGACPAARLPRAFVHIVSISPVRPLHTSLLPPASLTGRCLHNIL